MIGFMKATDFMLPTLRQLIDVPVKTKVPSDRPDRFVRVDQSPPTRITPVADSAIVIVQVYGQRTAKGVDWVVGECHRLRNVLVDNVQRFNENMLGWDEVQGPHEFPDPDLPNVCRYQFSGTLFYTPRM